MIDGILSPTTISSTDVLSTARVQDLQGKRDREDIRKAALEYESYFLAYLMKEMRSTVSKGSLTANPMGEAFYSFYDEEIGKRAAQSGGIGLTDFVLSSLANEPIKDSVQDPSQPSR
ncbi:MAG: rod-binding protein [Nitrospirales bacterium]